MKGKIPRGVPRVLPFVGHRNDVAIEQMPPVLVASCLPGAAGNGGTVFAAQPFRHDVVIELFGPAKTRMCLSEYTFFVRAEIVTGQRVRPGIGLSDSAFEDPIELAIERRSGEFLPIDEWAAVIRSRNRTVSPAGIVRQ